MIFRHVEHVGTDINNCRVIEPVYKAFFDKAGISDNLLENNETRTFIYDFIESHGGVNALKEEIVPTPEPQTCTSPPAKSEAKFDTPPPVPARTIPVSSNVSSSVRESQNYNFLWAMVIFFNKKKLIL